jgi:hypothetical protein
METLDKHFRDLTRAAFARHGFAHGEISARWTEIAGEALGRCSAPERINWPRGTGENAQKRGGTLVIRAAAGRALELQYEIPQIIERVNRFFGHGAIAAVKIAQDGSWHANTPTSAPAPSVNPAYSQEVAAIADEGLRTALERLGTGVARSSQVSPQHK